LTGRSVRELKRGVISGSK